MSGFGTTGIPNALINALIDKGARDLISNNVFICDAVRAFIGRHGGVLANVYGYRISRNSVLMYSTNNIAEC